MSHEHDNTIVIRTFNDFAEATAAREKLKEAGIDSIVEDENVLGMNPLGGVEVKIFAKDRDEAERILAS
jgi:hypothetical protein